MTSRSVLSAYRPYHDRRLPNFQNPLLDVSLGLSTLGVFLYCLMRQREAKTHLFDSSKGALNSDRSNSFFASSLAICASKNYGPGLEKHTELG
ncbi:hypothetical protein BDN70DRAFT_886405 [Pholiota conissans]|uniref:Uncharacterized protein n=1 Tax=Pholiota conissans TaxID=109636 RepID=A0A9P5YPZ5_9AGAR|nr:hypothetical protein BDN70DRAFT_886405 [Pholiota conissans]